MQIPSLGQNMSNGAVSAYSAFERRESMTLTQSSIEVSYSAADDTLTLTRTDTSLAVDTLYTAEGLFANELPETAANPALTEAGAAEETADTGVAEEATYEYLELIRERIAYLLQEAAEMSESFRAGLHDTVTNTAETEDVVQIIDTEAVFGASETAGVEDLMSDYSAESTAARIVQFALSFYDGGDREEFAAMVRDAIMEGFEQAKAALGGFLPEVSMETLNLVNAALDEFAAGGDVDTIA